MIETITKLDTVLIRIYAYSVAMVILQFGLARMGKRDRMSISL